MTALYIIIPSISSSREVIGGGDVRLLAMLYAINILNRRLTSEHKIKVILLSDRYYLDALKRFGKRSGVLNDSDLDLLVDKEFVLDFPRYLPPYTLHTLILRIILLAIKALKLLYKARAYSKNVLPFIRSSRPYEFIPTFTEVVSKKLVVYVQAPLDDVLGKVFISLLKFLEVVLRLRILFFVFNPIDYHIVTKIFRRGNVKVVLTLNGIFRELIQECNNESGKYYDVAYVGRLDPRKGAFENFIRFLSKLREAGIRVRALIVTSALNKEIREYVFKNLSRLTSFHDIHVYVNKSISEVYKLLTKSRILVMLSRFDTFNLAILEALTNGCCVIALNNPRIEGAYKVLLKKENLKFLREKLFFVKDVDEAVKVYISIKDKELCKSTTKELKSYIALDWYMIILKELIEVLRWISPR